MLNIISSFLALIKQFFILFKFFSNFYPRQTNLFILSYTYICLHSYLVNNYYLSLALFLFTFSLLIVIYLIFITGNFKKTHPLIYEYLIIIFSLLLLVSFFIICTFLVLSLIEILFNLNIKKKPSDDNPNSSFGNDGPSKGPNAGGNPNNGPEEEAIVGESPEERRKRKNREAASRYRNKNRTAEDQERIAKKQKFLLEETAEEKKERLKFIEGESALHRKQRLNLEAVERYNEKNGRKIKGSGRGYVDNETIEERRIRLTFTKGESFENRQVRLNNLAAERYRTNNPDKVKESQSKYTFSDKGKETRKTYREENKDYLNEVKMN